MEHYSAEQMADSLGNSTELHSDYHSVDLKVSRMAVPTGRLMAGLLAVLMALMSVVLTDDWKVPMKADLTELSSELPSADLMVPPMDNSKAGYLVGLTVDC